MMNEKDYLTVKEFAKIANISRQTIYNNLDTYFKDYVKLDKGRKLIDVRALRAIYGIQNSQKTVQDEVKESLVMDSDLDSYVQHVYNLDNELQEQLIKQIDFLQSQLEQKDQQLEQSNIRLAEALKLNENNQILLKQSQDKILELEAPKEKTLFKRLFGK